MAFSNINKCRNFNKVAVTSAWYKLSSFEATEVLIHNHGSGTVDIACSNEQILADGNPDPNQTFRLEDNDSTTFMGITNTDQISAKSNSAEARLECNARFYSSFPLR